MKPLPEKWGYSFKRPVKKKLTRFEQKLADEWSKQVGDYWDVRHEHNVSRRDNPVRFDALLTRYKLENDIFMAVK